MAENAGNTGASALTAKMMASSPASEKKHRSNGNASPAHQASNHSSPAAAETLTPPAVSEKKPQTNGQASPVRLPANGSNSHAGLEGFLKTDDRMRLAKERREERERSLVAREQAIREKERRAQLQYERTVEERWKRLEEQKLKEEQRRAAVEEKRRQQLEEEKERLEALMRKSLERSLQLENRTKRWIWGGNGPGHGDWENAPPLSAASALPYDLAAPSAAASESGNVTSSPHRSPYRGSPSRRRGNTAFTEELGRGSNTAPSTPKKGSLRKERGAASPATGSPVRRADDVIRRSASPASPATPKLTPKRRNQSPATVRQYPASPLRHRAATPAAGSSKGPEEKVTDDNQDANVKSQDPADQKPLQAEEASIKSLDSVIPGTAGKMDSPIQKASSPEAPEKGARKTENPSGAVRAASGQKVPNSGNQEQQSLKTGIAHNHSTNNLTSCKSTDQSPATPTHKTAAMVTDAEEASRLLAERKRLAQVQKKQEELERQNPELIKRKVDERVREEEETQHEEDELRVRKTEEEDLQVQLEQERDVAERQRQDRELMQQQEEQERQQRKKRIEEIMKRTRKNDGELKREDNQESQLVSPLSPPGEVQVDSKPRSEAKAPPTGPQAGSTPGSQAPPTGAQAGCVPGSPAPPTGAQAGSTPGSQAPPNGSQAGSTPGSHSPLSAAQARSALDSWVKPPAPVTPSRQNSMEKRSESFGGNERPHAPAQVLSPSPNGQAQSAKPLDQKGGRGPEKIQSSSTSRGEEVGKDNSPPEKGQANQPKATAEAIAQKHENVLPDQDRELEAPQVKVPLPGPQPQATSTRAGEVKRLVPERATNPHEAWAAQSKSAVKMPDGPQVNGQVKPQICAAQLNTQANPQPNGQTPSQVMLKGEVKERSPASLPPLAVSWSPPPLISLEPLEGRGGAREKAVDEVQSMEISPVSKEELISIPRFSPVTDVRPNSVSKTRALEDLLDLTGQVAYPKIPPSATMGDCNKNLIEGVCSPGTETKVITSSPPPSNKLNIQ